MPVTVLLSDLVRLPGGENLWPEEFRAFVRSIGKNFDRTAFGACADWLDENVNEPKLSAAFRFAADRKDVTVYRERGKDEWRIYGLGAVAEAVMKSARVNWPNVAHLMADLADALEAAREKLKKELEQLG